MSKTKTDTAPKTTEVAATEGTLDYTEGGRRAELYLRVLDEWERRKEADPHDPNIAFGRRGELTVERDRAWAALREWIAPVLAEAEAQRLRKAAEEEAAAESRRPGRRLGRRSGRQPGMDGP
jgi:hypothetical protein